MGKKIAKRLQALQAKIDANKIYDVASGVSLVKSLASTKFDETVEIALRLGVDPRHADQMIRGRKLQTLRHRCHAPKNDLWRSLSPPQDCRP